MKNRISGSIDPRTPSKNQHDNLEASHRLLKVEVRSNYISHRERWLALSSRTSRRFSNFKAAIAVIAIWQTALTAAVGYNLGATLGWF